MNRDEMAYEIKRKREQALKAISANELSEIQEASTSDNNETQSIEDKLKVIEHWLRGGKIGIGKLNIYTQRYVPLESWSPLKALIEGNIVIRNQSVKKYRVAYRFIDDSIDKVHVSTSYHESKEDFINYSGSEVEFIQLMDSTEKQFDE